MNSSNPGSHSGYAEAGTVLLQDGERINVDPKTLKPLPSPEEAMQPQTASEPIPEKSKPSSKSLEKATTDTNPSE